MNADMVELQIAAQPVVEKIPKELPLSERIKFAMRYVREKKNELFWMSHSVNDDLMMRTALAAVMLAGNEADREEIRKGMRPLRMLSAAMQGIPVDFTQLAAEGEVLTLPILKLWKESANVG